MVVSAHGSRQTVDDTRRQDSLNGRFLAAPASAYYKLLDCGENYTRVIEVCYAVRCHDVGLGNSMTWRQRGSDSAGLKVDPDRSAEKEVI